MALLKVNLPPRSLAGVYSRIVRRELGLPAYFLGSSGGLGQVAGLFARSLAVAVGQAFAAGESVRAEFALALRNRLRQYERKSGIGQALPLVEAFGHSIALSEIIAGERSGTADRRIEISDNAVANAAEADVHRLSFRAEEINWAQEETHSSLWSGTPAPSWWQQYPEAPDRWVAPMSQLGEPLWTSRLSGESLTYLLNFGLDRIDSKPELIQPWTQSVSSLVAAASRPRADIREVVNCCRVDP
jgi:hypothetical protein